MTAKYSRQNFCCGKVKKGQEKHFGRLSHNFLCDHLLLDVILADCNKLLYLSDLFDGRISYSALQPISARFPSAAARSWNVFEQNSRTSPIFGQHPIATLYKETEYKKCMILIAWYIYSLTSYHMHCFSLNPPRQSSSYICCWLFVKYLVSMMTKATVFLNLM